MGGAEGGSEKLYLCESQAELSRGEGEKQAGMGILTAPQGFGFVGVQHRDAPRLRKWKVQVVMRLQGFFCPHLSSSSFPPSA